MVCAHIVKTRTVTSRFFIKLIHKRLNGGYAVFGRVTGGMEVVDAIAALETRVAGGAFVNLPVETVVIKSARRGNKRSQNPETGRIIFAELQKRFFL
jgi:cyclophilin family peptidyl-prolyl cis-trans isomerase